MLSISFSVFFQLKCIFDQEKLTGQVFIAENMYYITTWITHTQDAIALCCPPCHHSATCGIPTRFGSPNATGCSGDLKANQKGSSCTIWRQYHCSLLWQGRCTLQQIERPTSGSRRVRFDVNAIAPLRRKKMTHPAAERQNTSLRRDCSDQQCNINTGFSLFFRTSKPYTPKTMTISLLPLSTI